MSRSTLDRVLTEASQVVGRETLPELVPAEERHYGEREYLCDMLSLHSEDVAAADPIGKLESRAAGLAYQALRSGDLHLMRAALAYVIRGIAHATVDSDDRVAEPIEAAAQ